MLLGFLLPRSRSALILLTLLLLILAALVLLSRLALERLGRGGILDAQD